MLMTFAGMELNCSKEKLVIVMLAKQNFIYGQEESLVFKYVGIYFNQKRDSSIMIHQHDYISDIQVTDVDRERAFMKKDPLTDKES